MTEQEIAFLDAWQNAVANNKNCALPIPNKYPAELIRWILTNVYNMDPHELRKTHTDEFLSGLRMNGMYAKVCAESGCLNLAARTDYFLAAVFPDIYHFNRKKHYVEQLSRATPNTLKALAKLKTKDFAIWSYIDWILSTVYNIDNVEERMKALAVDGIAYKSIMELPYSQMIKFNFETMLDFYYAYLDPKTRKEYAQAYFNIRIKQPGLYGDYLRQLVEEKKKTIKPAVKTNKIHIT